MKLIQRRYRKWRMSKLLLFPHHCLDDTSYRLVLYIVCTYLLIDSCCAVRQGALSITFCMNLRRWQDANFQVKKFGTRQSVCCMNNSKQWCDLVVAELLCFFFWHKDQLILWWVIELLRWLFSLVSSTVALDSWGVSPKLAICYLGRSSWNLEIWIFSDW